MPVLSLSSISSEVAFFSSCLVAVLASCAITAHLARPCMPVATVEMSGAPWLALCPAMTSSTIELTCSSSTSTSLAVESTIDLSSNSLSATFTLVASDAVSMSASIFSAEPTLRPPSAARRRP